MQLCDGCSYPEAEQSMKVYLVQLLLCSLVHLVKISLGQKRLILAVSMFCWAPSCLQAGCARAGNKNSRLSSRAALAVLIQIIVWFLETYHRTRFHEVFYSSPGLRALTQALEQKNFGFSAQF